MDLLSDKMPMVLADSQTFRPWPDDMAQFDLPSPDAFAGTHKSAFADPARCEYPLTSRELTFFGAIHYRGRGGSDKGILDRFQKAASSWGVEEQLAAYEPFFNQVKSAGVAAPEAPPARFALSVKQASSDEPLNLYPLACAEDVGPAAAQIVSDYETGKLPLGLFGRASREVVKAAAAWNITKLPARVLEAGVDRLADPEHAAIHIPANAAPELKEAYQKLALAAEQANGNERDELADAWEHLDRALSVTRGQQDPTPYGVLWGGAPRELVVKAANEFALFDKVGENVLVPRAALASINVESARQQLRKPDADALEAVIKAASDASQNPTVVLLGLDVECQRRLLKTVLELTS